MMNCLNYLILSYKSVKIQYIVYKWEREKLQKHVQMDSSAAVRLFVQNICNN